MRAFARFVLADGTARELGHGDLIGRLSSAALVVDDPRVSEAHAMVSLRRGELYLLSLRRMIAVDAKPASEVALRAGMVVSLADGVELIVEAVQTPERIVAIESAQLGRRALAEDSSLYAGPPPDLVGRFEPDADAHVWTDGLRWHARVGGQDVRPIATGDELVLPGGVSMRICTIALGDAGQAPTEMTGGVQVPLRIVAGYDSVEIHRAEKPVERIGGLGARIVSELVAFDGPVSWDVLARELWTDEDSPTALRHRWDVALGRLRARLRKVGVRPDLVTADGGGQVALVLYDGDAAEDRT